MARKLNSSLISAIIVSVFLAITPLPAKAQQEGFVLFSPYPGSTGLEKYIVSNFPGQDGMGLHWTGQNDPGIDIRSQDGAVYSPIKVCSSEGGRIVVTNDTFGQGGHGLVLEQDGVRIEMWHLAGYSDLLSKKILDDRCVEPHDLLGFEGESTTVYSNGVPVLSTFSEQNWSLPAHTHLAVAKTTPWNNKCAERFVGGWYFTNPVCVTQLWNLEDMQGDGSAEINVAAVLQDLFFQPKPGETVPSENPANKEAGVLPMWFWIAAVFVVAGILTMRTGGNQ